MAPPLGIAGQVEDPYDSTWGGGSRDPEPGFIVGDAWRLMLYLASVMLDVGEP
jgi:hypothetical protein